MESILPVQPVVAVPVTVQSKFYSRNVTKFPGFVISNME